MRPARAVVAGQRSVGAAAHLAVGLPARQIDVTMHQSSASIRVDNETADATTDVESADLHVRCGGCAVTLTYSIGASTVSCPECKERNKITQAVRRVSWIEIVSNDPSSDEVNVHTRCLL